jgi:hypothetical protein
VEAEYGIIRNETTFLDCAVVTRVQCGCKWAGRLRFVVDWKDAIYQEQGPCALDALQE